VVVDDVDVVEQLVGPLDVGQLEAVAALVLALGIEPAPVDRAGGVAVVNSTTPVASGLEASASWATTRLGTPVDGRGMGTHGGATMPMRSGSPVVPDNGNCLPVVPARARPVAARPPGRRSSNTPKGM